MKRTFLLLALVILVPACPKTEFHGSPYFPDGAQGCKAQCSRDGLEMSGFVYSGEFATSCVCRAKESAGWPAAPPAPYPPPPAPTSGKEHGKDSRAALDAADASAAIGVVMQTRDQQQQQQQQQAGR